MIFALDVRIKLHESQTSQESAICSELAELMCAIVGRWLLRRGGWSGMIDAAEPSIFVAVVDLICHRRTLSLFTCDFSAFRTAKYRTTLRRAIAATDFISNWLNQPIYQEHLYTDATQTPPPRDEPSADASPYSTASFPADPVPSPTPKIHISSGNDGAEIRFPLGENVFATAGHYKGKATLAMRYFYRPRPDQEDVWKGGKKGVVLTPEQWRTLKRNMSGVSAALLACTFAAMPYDATVFSPRRFHLGNLTYAIVEVFKGSAVVAIREFYRRSPEDGDNLLPGKRGLNLSAEQWKELQEHSQKMDAVLEAVVENTVVLTDKLLSDIAGGRMFIFLRGLGWFPKIVGGGGGPGTQDGAEIPNPPTRMKHGTTSSTGFTTTLDTLQGIVE
ncbi:hypothetical protein Bbelb_216820 [Branchiostoma belcheri]|nr:hypothetical protein Bbelb_216820 [Branchiostoma belcheri]